MKYERIVNYREIPLKSVPGKLCDKKHSKLIVGKEQGQGGGEKRKIGVCSSYSQRSAVVSHNNEIQLGTQKSCSFVELVLFCA